MVFKTCLRRKEKKPTLIQKSESSEFLDVISSLLQLQVDHILVKVQKFQTIPENRSTVNQA